MDFVMSTDKSENESESENMNKYVDFSKREKKSCKTKSYRRDWVIRLYSRILCVSFSRRDSDLSIYHLSV